MNKWTGVLAAALTSLLLAACGGVEDAGSQQAVLGQQEAAIDVCGNGLCYSGEPSYCPEDCTYGGYCGDGSCSGPETSSNCSQDCSGGGGCFVAEEPDKPVEGIDVCGNGLCARGESSYCPEDCNYGGYCGDGVCSGPETRSTCSTDCRC